MFVLFPYIETSTLVLPNSRYADPAAWDTVPSFTTALPQAKEGGAPEAPQGTEKRLHRTTEDLFLCPGVYVFITERKKRVRRVRSRFMIEEGRGAGARAAREGGREQDRGKGFPGGD